MVETDLLLTTRQLQSLLQVDRITIYRMLNDGRLQGFKVGGQWRFSRQAIERWLQEQQASLEVPTAPCPDDHLPPSVHSLPLSCIQAIQDIFAEAVGVAAVTTAVDGTPITPIANSCEYCTLILGSQVGRQRCTSAWRVAAKQSVDPPRATTCHAGLSYAWGQIEVRGTFLAAIQAGQFLEEPPDLDGVWKDRIAELSSATGIRAGALSSALPSVPVLDSHRRHLILRMVKRVAETFSEIGEERLSLLGRLQRISEISTL